MSNPTPLYRNLVLEKAIEEGCPQEVTKEAIAEAHAQMAATGRSGWSSEEFSEHVAAYAYTAGRVARWDALVKGSPRLMDAIFKAVHEFFHDEPFSAHDGTGEDCPDCPAVSALAADAAAAYYAQGFNSTPVDPDVLIAALDDLDPEDDEWTSEQETAAVLADPAVMADLATAEAETRAYPLIEMTPDKFGEGEWRVASDAEIRHG